MVISVHLKVALCFFHSPLTATCHLNINDNAIETLAFMRQNLVVDVSAGCAVVTSLAQPAYCAMLWQ